MLLTVPVDVDATLRDSIRAILMTSILQNTAIAMLLGEFAMLAAPAIAAAATLEVGPGKPFARIEDANAKARPGDVVLVYAGSSRRQYEKTAVFVRQRDLTFRGVPAAGKTCVPINGHGFDYSGAGSTPRAIFQFNAGADHCTLEGFELFGAHNTSHNGAGVRINQANHVTVRNCSIHGNDMGIMSNGDGTLARGVDQRIERCQIYRNGDTSEPGQNHNLYLGGTSVTLRFCEVHHSLTGHNVKSRATLYAGRILLRSSLGQSRVRPGRRRRDGPTGKRRRAAGQHHRQGPPLRRQSRRAALRPGRRQRAQRHALSGLQHDRHAVSLARN